MALQIGAQEFYNLSKEVPVIDARSPKEFETGHYPGAINIPIFSNEERAMVGTLYKKKSRNEAILKGLEIVGPKLKVFAKKAQSASKNNSLVIYCWRGGMRSASMAWLFETLGIKTFVLEGGYKAFRRYGKSLFTKTRHLIVLGGLTGSGKTETLLKINEKGEQIVDLEGIAHHKGSVFGALGQDPQPTNEQFENNLIYEWLKLDLQKPVWVEDESHSIGSNWIPNELYKLIRKSTVLKMELDKNLRIKRLVNEYSGFDVKYLETCIHKIGKKLGGQHVKTATDSLKKGHLHHVVDTVLFYYDKSYGFGIGNRKTDSVYPVKLEQDNPKKNAEILIEFAKKNLFSSSFSQV